MRRSVCNACAGASNAGRSLCVQISRERSYPCQHIDTTRKAINCATTLQTFRPLLSKLSKRRQIYIIYPHFEEVTGGVEPWLMGRWKTRVEFLLSAIELLFLYLTVVVKTRCLQEGVGHLEPRFQGEKVVPVRIYWYRSKGNWLRYNFAAESFYIMKPCSRLLVFYCRNCQKDDKFRYLIPILRKLGGRRRTLVDSSLESTCRLLFNCNWTFFLSLAADELQGKTYQNSLLVRGLSQMSQNFRGKVSSLGNIFWFLEN